MNFIMKTLLCMCNTFLLTAISSLLFSGDLYAQKVNLGDLQRKNPELKYVAIGSSLSAGVQNGGLYREGQISAFPNLIAKQMGLADFKQPLFSIEEQNGTGYKQVREVHGTLQFSEIPGSFSENERLPKALFQIDNLAIPFLKVENIMIDESQGGSFLPAFERKSYKHLYRLVEEQDDGKISYYAHVQRRVNNIDFFTYEIGMHDFVSYYVNGGYGQPISMMKTDREGYFPENQLIQYLLSKGASGVIANVPDVLKFPFFRYYEYEKIVSIIGNQVFTEFLGKSSVRKIMANDLFVPTSNINDLFNNISTIGRSQTNPLLDQNVIGYEEQIDVNLYNSWIEAIARINKLPVVDLYKLYSKIIAGEYTTHDGVKIDPSYPNGNFFSSDGIHPTKIGQAVIANEFIKVINLNYQSQIPFVSILNLK